MGKVFEGRFEAPGKRVAIAVSRFNDFFTKELLGGARDCLARHGVPDDDVDVAWVPGSFELPLVARRLARTGRYGAVVCLGCLIQGDTPHFQLIAAEVTKGVAQAALETGVPITFGVITAETIEQAIERAGTKAGNKGFDAALAALEMMGLMEAIGPDGQ
ncbi:MAG TPA: 6,7-dimethyl-8-ribityllumazine synthase [Vicinamibacterales bacterium]|nr:6,7-dimethyl-8-ribityllumazine synthase [Acidobacteriota bacterium]HOC17143.1 6,7-dimethyl-8-ribityllumazine synthase [Vicinamibacterales bacterium]